MTPTLDGVNRVPALDNGELLWAVSAAVHQSWLNYTKSTAALIFYNSTNPTKGKVCAVVDLNMTLSPTFPSQEYTCEPGDPGTLNDPYEGELFTWWLYFYSNLSTADKEALWTYKRPQLVAVNYTGSTINSSSSYSIATKYSGMNVTHPISHPITVQKGLWFSSHETWKLLELPYTALPLINRVFHNAERARTCNSVVMGQNPGMFASVNNITDPVTNQIDGYISYAGIPSISVQQEQEVDVVTPYSVFPTVLFNRSVGLVWYKNTLDEKGMQNPYGSPKSLRRDGTEVSAFVSWDSKVTTLVALLGGVGEFTGAKLEEEGLYEEFKHILEREYSAVFGEGSGRPLVGKDVDLCLPDSRVPVVNMTDFTMCHA